MQEGHATSHLVRNHSRKSYRSKPAKQSYKTAQSLLSTYQIDVDLCLSLQHVCPCDMPVILRYKSKEELVGIKHSLENFFNRFEQDKHFRKQVSVKRWGWEKILILLRKKN